VVEEGLETINKGITATGIIFFHPFVLHMNDLQAEFERRAPQATVVDKISKEDLQQLLELIQDWSAAHGMIVAESSVCPLFAFVWPLINQL